MTETHGLRVGSPIGLRENWDLLPVGTVVEYRATGHSSRNGRTLTKREEGWYDSSRAQLVTGGRMSGYSLIANRVLSLPAPLPAVGDEMTTIAMYDAVPVGSTVTVRHDDTALWTKQPDGRWTNLVGRNIRSSEFAMSGNFLASLGTQALRSSRPEWMVVDHHLTTMEQIEALPIGSQVQWRRGSGNNLTYVRVETGWRRVDGVGSGQSARATFSPSAAVENFIHFLPPEALAGQEWMVVGHVMGVGDVDKQTHVAALPIGSTVDYLHNPDRNRVNHQYTKRRANTWSVATNPSGPTCSDRDIANDNARVTIMALPSQEGTTAVTTTLADLEAVPIGSLITTTESGSPNSWTRTSTGFTRNGAEVPMHFFTGLLPAGHVIIGARYQADQVWRDGRYYRMVYEVVDGAPKTATYIKREGDLPYFYTHETHRATSSLGEIISEHQPWMSGALTAARAYGVAMRQSAVAPAAVVDTGEVERLRLSLAGEQERARAFRTNVERLAREVNDYLDDQDETRGHSLDDSLESLGLPYREPETETITVTVGVSGRSEIDVSEHLNVASAIGGGVDWDDDHSESTITVCWTRNVEVEVTVNDGDCGCGEVTDSMIESALDAEGVNYSSFSADETSCSND